MKGVLILLVLGLVYLAKETLLDEAEAFPTPGGEGSRSLVRESKMLIKVSADRLNAQGPDPEGRPKSSGISLPSYELRLFPTTTQTFSMVRERKRREVNNGERLLPAVNIPKTEIQNISFDCPTTKCKSSDCVVVFPVQRLVGMERLSRDGVPAVPGLASDGKNNTRHHCKCTPRNVVFH